MEKSLDVRNTATKFIFDQTLGASYNTIAFLAGLTAMRGGGLGGCITVIRQVNDNSYQDSMYCHEILNISFILGVLAYHDRRLQALAFGQPRKLHSDSNGEANSRRESCRPRMGCLPGIKKQLNGRVVTMKVSKAKFHLCQSSYL